MSLGVTELMRDRMKMESKCLTEEQKTVSIMIEEVGIKGKQTYLKNIDKTIGGVDIAGVVEVEDPNALANKLLMFAINGLSASFTILVGMFLVCSLIAEELIKMTKYVIEEVEKLGFRVHQLVTDNLAVNTKMY